MTADPDRSLGVVHPEADHHDEEGQHRDKEAEPDDPPYPSHPDARGKIRERLGPSGRSFPAAEDRIAVSICLGHAPECSSRNFKSPWRPGVRTRPS